MTRTSRKTCVRGRAEFDEEEDRNDADDTKKKGEPLSAKGGVGER